MITNIIRPKSKLKFEKDELCVEFVSRFVEQRYPDEHWEKYIENSMRQIWNILKSKEQQNTRIKRRKVLFQIWVSFAGWLAYWKNKSEEKLEPIDFETMINYIKTLATGESTTQESSPE